MNDPQETYLTPYQAGAAMMLRCHALELSGNDADVVTAIAVATAAALDADGKNDVLLEIVVMCAKAAYMMGRERGGFVGYG